MSQVRELRKQLVAAAACTLMAAFALCSATYAWYVANNKVQANTSTISATTNGFVLQIDSLKNGAQHGGEQKSLEALTQGATLSPSSSDDLDNWYICQGWDDSGRVTKYGVPKFVEDDSASEGLYRVDGNDYHAFIRSDYIVYTITETGAADVYLDASDGDPITITAKDNGAIAQTVKGSMRVAITTQQIGADGKSGTGPEDLRVVYAFDNETGKGNDSQAIDGWTSIQDINGIPTLRAVSYPYIYAGHYQDQLDTSRNWVAQKDGDNYTVSVGSEPIAKKVGYNGVAVHVYIWLEGTDSDCVNGKSIENDPSTYNVTVKLAGVAAN